MTELEKRIIVLEEEVKELQRAIDGMMFALRCAMEKMNMNPSMHSGDSDAESASH